LSRASRDPAATSPGSPAVEFAPDSPLEQSGFEPPVPLPSRTWAEPYTGRLKFCSGTEPWQRRDHERTSSQPTKLLVLRERDGSRKFAPDSSLEEAGFEPSVPRATTKVSRAAHVASA
jgi:hypothetical protein